MITTNRPKSSVAKEKAEEFQKVLNELIGFGYKQKDIDFVKSSKKDFNAFISKVPPLFYLTAKQIEMGIAPETKNFLLKTLYLLPSTIRANLLCNDTVVNKIISLYHKQFDSTLDVNAFDDETQKEILYEAWFVFRLMERRVQDGSMNFTKESIYARILTSVIGNLVFCPRNDDKLNETIEPVIDILQPKDYFDRYAQQVTNFLGPNLMFSDVVKAANDIIKYVGPVRDSKEITQKDSDALLEYGITMQQVEIVGRYSWGKAKFQNNYLFNSVAHTCNILEVFTRHAAKHGWSISKTPNITNDEFEKLVAIIFVMSDPIAEKELNEFMGIFITMCYCCWFVNSEGESIFEEEAFIDFTSFMFTLVERYTAASYEGDDCTIMPPVLSESETEEQISTEQVLPPQASEQEVISLTPNVPVLSSPSNFTKEITMSTSPSTPVAIMATTDATTINASANETAGTTTAPVTSMTQPGTNATAPVKHESATVSEEEKKKQDQLESILKTLVAEAVKNASEGTDKPSTVDTTDIMARIRAIADEKQSNNSTSYDAPKLTTMETVVVSTVAVVAVAAIGYSVYRLISDLND